MASKRSGRARRIQLLRNARKNLASVAKSRFLKRLPAALARMDRDAVRVRRRAKAGEITKQQASRSLRRFADMRREGARLLLSTRTVAQRSLKAIERELERLQGES